ncbi:MULTISPECIES: GNAT family N-acetyltransferase [Dysgonomonas]|uniref:GNAT family N-acetyltransferase n=1 Tax=Dysgonomonas TaxID=156973 RepID=UPI0009277C96|nr:MULTISPECIES: GNAT family N-acetyltransferase [Dysgonomonas]MBN9302343.1 GNAT family N-acetyltransferase [Dysgonomonas mossii]MBS5796407.1 GNAT family N-acetyltransferase [Dysgonomonas mossii]MBS7110162.1 GNAT family N-acetyltransferase [Dysgonomonas mossii]OJX63665.1 MAG: GNAT family N-acetyltransferase [Dysgonomonas sp. 37-18]
MNFALHSERIKLRAILKTDTEAIYNYRSLPEVAKYQYWEPFTMEQAHDFVSRCCNPDLDEEDQWIGLAIVYQGKVIGDCAFNISENIAEVGCNISPEYQGMGLARESLSILIRYFLKNKDIKEIIGITDSRNIASVRLMQSLGMVKVPDFETRLVCKGEDCIEHKYAIRIHD